MKKSTMESLRSSPSTKVLRSNCRTVIFATDGGGGNTATTLEHQNNKSANKKGGQWTSIKWYNYWTDPPLH